jgi:hypothetical protein
MFQLLGCPRSYPYSFLLMGVWGLRPQRGVQGGSAPLALKPRDLTAFPRGAVQFGMEFDVQLVDFGH